LAHLGDTGKSLCADNLPTTLEGMADYCTVNTQCTADSDTTTNAPMSSTTVVEDVSTTELDCDADVNFYRTDCYEVPAGDGCSLLLTMEVDICILDLRWDREKLFNEMKLPVVLLLAANQIDFCEDVDQLSIESFDFIFADEQTQSDAFSTISACPNVVSACDRSKRIGNRFPITVLLEIGLYCGTCADTKSLAQSMFDIISDGTFASGFVDDCIDKTRNDDKKCNAGFGGVDVESATVEYRNADGEVEGGVITIVNSSGATERFGFLWMFFAFIMFLW